MSGRSFQFGGYGGGGINQQDIPSSAHYDRGTTNYRTPEGKAARTLVGLLDKMSFDTASFAYLLAVEGGNEMRRRILGIAIGIIKHYASQWEHGVSQDDVARDAMRLKDTLDKFKM
jgi:hypothetical protein